MIYLLTNEGINLKAKVNAGMKLHLTKAEGGTGYSENPSTLQAVIDKKQTLQIDSVNAEAGIAVINCVLSNLEVVNEYVLKQIGIYALDEDTQKEILFIIGQQENGDFIPAISEMEVEYTYLIRQIVSNTSEIKIDAGANDFVRKQLFYDHTNNQSNPHKITKTQVGLANVDNTSDVSKPVSIAMQEAIDTAYVSGNAYTDVKIGNLINGAPETLNTLKEVADAIADNENIVEALNSAIGTKASKAEMDTHTGNNTIHIMNSERTKWNAKQDKMTVDEALSTTSTNTVQNKAVTAAINEQNVSLTNSITELNQSLNTVSFDPQPDGLYADYKVGADSVRKKLGSTIKYLGTGTSFNVSANPNYKKFTANNFIVGFTSYHGNVKITETGAGANYDLNSDRQNISKTYNPATGILSIGGTSVSSSHTPNGLIYVRAYVDVCFAYLVEGDIS